MDISIIKRKITQSDIGRYALFATEEEKIKPDVHLNCNIKQIPDKRLRSYEQLKLYWSSCNLVSENNEDDNFNTKDKVDEQTKIYCRLVDCYYYYENKKTGEKTLNIKTGSISYEQLQHLEACSYFDQAFKYHADLLKITVDELMKEIESRGNTRKYSHLGHEVDGIKFEDKELFE